MRCFEHPAPLLHAAEMLGSRPLPAAALQDICAPVGPKHFSLSLHQSAGARSRGCQTSALSAWVAKQRPLPPLLGRHQRAGSRCRGVGQISTALHLRSQCRDFQLSSSRELPCSVSRQCQAQTRVRYSSPVPGHGNSLARTDLSRHILSSI